MSCRSLRPFPRNCGSDASATNCHRHPILLTVSSDGFEAVLGLGERLVRVEGLPGLQAVVQAAQQPVEQVVHGRGVTVTGSAATVVVFLDLGRGQRAEDPYVAGRGKPLIFHLAVPHHVALAAGDGDRR